MKKNLLIFSVLFSGFISAQTTVTKSFNDPIVGDVLSNVVLNGTVNNTPAGSNVTYNNSTVTAGAASVNTYSAVTAAELVNFVGATIKHNDGNGILVYYKQSADKLEIVGIDNPSGTLKFTNPGTAIVYPSSFGSTNTDQAQGSLVSSGTTAYFRGNIVSNADATGTLIVGSQIFNNILRLKITQNYTIYLDPTMFVSIGSATNTSYMYFDATHKFPILSSADMSVVVASAGINQSTSGSQAQNFIFLGTNEVTKDKVVMLFPNPAKDVLYIQGNKLEDSEIEIYNLEGRKINEFKLENDHINVSSLPKGVYILKIKHKNGEILSSKFIKN